MQNKEIEPMQLAMLSVPINMLEEVGVCEGGVFQFYVSDGRLIIEPVDDEGDFVCDGDCEHCPISAMDCNGDCKNCPCKNYCDEGEGS